ncbi:MAG TPA: S49 family peptidase [Kutzneria sp.]|jgi:signal peptide peptidase SppA
MNVPEKLADKLAAKLPLLGDRVDRSPVVAVVRLHGVITPTPQPLGRGAINLNAVEPALAKAFGHDRLQAVALAINSPGGSPTQSALVGERIRELAAKKNVPVLAFCEDVAASGGYWLACAADEIYAHRTSMVGSIGVITAGFGLTGLLERFGVERRVYTAGEHKHRLDPFSPVKPEDIAWLKGLQGELHTEFTDWVKQRRGAKLADNPELFTGEVWTGARAAELGLVDGLGSLREIVAKKYPEADIAVAEPRKSLLARLGIAGGSSVFAGAGDKVLAAIDAVEQRAHWSRFGL